MQKMKFKRIQPAHAGFGDHSCSVRESGRYAFVVDNQIVAVLYDEASRYGGRKYMDSANWMVAGSKELDRPLTEFEISNPHVLFHHVFMQKTLRDAKALITKKILSKEGSDFD